MIDQKTILITGAGSGIGAATVRRFAEAGWFVGAYDINLEAVEKLAGEMGLSVRAGTIDVVERASVEAALADFTSITGGRLDSMCNNAGIFNDCEFADADPDFLLKIIRVNADGVLNGCQAAFPYLRDTKGARLVNLASAASIYGVPNEATYSATKFFVRGLSEALELEWERHDIAVSIIMPSYVSTPMLHNNEISWSEKSDVKVTAEDIASLIVQATNSPKLYWMTPRETKLQSLLVRYLPRPLLRAFVRKIFYQEHQV